MKAVLDKIMNTWWLRHLLFWLITWAYYSLGLGMTAAAFTQANIIKAFKTFLPYIPGFCIVCYPLLYLLIPKLLVKKKYLLFILSYLGLILLVGGGYANKFNLTVWSRSDFSGFKINIGRNILPFIHISGIATAIKFIKKAYTEELVTARSEEQKILAELELLKAQIHPHFLFNTLNNLFAHTLRNSSDAPNIVLKLSELLRFMIYDSKQEKIPLPDEIGLIQNYIDLEKLRYGKEMNCRMEVEGNPEGLTIRPLLLIPLIENAFKHGMSQQTGDKWIHLSITISGQSLKVDIENSRSELSGQERDRQGPGGVGLENVRKRLQLLYPGRHAFDITVMDNYFHVVLQVPLDKELTETKLVRDSRSVAANI